MSTPHAQGQKSKNQTAGEPQGRKLQKKEFRTDREEKITTATFSLPNCIETKTVKKFSESCETGIVTTSRSLSCENEYVAKSTVTVI